MEGIHLHPLLRQALQKMSEITVLSVFEPPIVQSGWFCWRETQARQAVVD